MNLSNFLAVLRARWIPAFIVFVLVVSAAVAYVVLAPRTYTATATLVIDAKPDPVSSMLYGGGTSPSMINTQLEIIHSDRVAQRVIQNLKLTEMADLQTQWKEGGKAGTIQDWLTNILQSGLDAGVARPGSNVITVGYRARDPRFASTVANAFMQAYLETSIELRVDPAKQYSGFFNDQAKEARDTLEKAQAKLSAFQREKGIIGTDDKLDLEMNRLAMLTQELVTVQSQRMDTSTRQQQVGGNANQMAEVLTSGAVNSVKSELSAAELKLQELSARYGNNHPQVQDARNTVNDLKQRLERETRNVTGSVTMNANVSRAREGEVRSSLDAQRNKVLQLKQVRDEGSVLARDVDNAQRAYDMVFNRFAATNLESQNRQSNATVISQASPPSEPSSPKVVANLLMGFVAALGAALATALLIEQFDKRVRTPADAMAALGLPIIGIMPTPNMSRRLKGQMALTRERVVSGRRLSAPDKGSNA
jgi:chain length determinant protein EpsF